MISPLYTIGHPDIAGIVARLTPRDTYAFRACLAVMRSRTARQAGCLTTARAELGTARIFLAKSLSLGECAPC